MKKFNKQFSYKNYNFSTTVDLNTKIERRLNGNTWHTVTTRGEVIITGKSKDGIYSIIDSNYQQKDEVLSTELENCIKKHQEEAQNYVDNYNNIQSTQSHEEILLIQLGFTKK